MVELVLDGPVIEETDAAWLVSIDGDEVWLPKSKCDMDGDGTIMVPEWLASDRSLI